MSPHIHAGQLVEGRYRIVSHIADGGMGTVYVAHDERLERDVALKILRPDLSRNPAFVERFRREAQAAARLYHPHVVPVHDQGNDGTYVFLAMELIRGGRTLRDEIQRGGNSVERSLHLLDQALDGLSAAHEAGIVHRDVKPENMLISPDGVVKVADFGLARAATATGMTAESDALIGTAPYLAPEQVEHGIVDKRSDVYAAGLVLFEMLTGKRAFDGDVPVNVAYQHVHSELPLVASVQPELAVFDDLLATVCAKDPDTRPADAGQFLTKLASVSAALSPQTLSITTSAGPVGYGTRIDPSPRPASQDHLAAGGPTDDTERTQTLVPRGGGSSRASEPAATTTIGPTPTQVVPTAAAPKPHQVPRRWPLVAAGVVGLGVLGTGAWAFMGGPLAKKTVPATAGLTQGVAVQRLRSAGFRVTTRQVNSDQVAATRIVGTDPPAGSSHRPAQAVQLLVSMGPQMIQIPDVTGKTQAEAEKRLRDAGFDSFTTTQRHDVRDVGSVITTTPVAGRRVDHRTRIQLVISQGKLRSTMPDLEKVPQDQARSRLTQLGVTVTSSEEYHADVARGAVISTSPKAGDTIETGDSVSLVVSKGPEMIDLPDVTGKSASEAKRTLTDLGFKVKGSDFLDDLLDRKVKTQEPPGGAGQQAAKGSEVTLGF